MGNIPENVKGVVDIDPWLEPFAEVLSERRYLADEWKHNITHNGKTPTTLSTFARDAYKSYGLHANQDTGVITYKEWAPNAERAFLIGEFNKWDESSHEMKKDEYGTFFLSIPPIGGDKKHFAIPHDSKLKVMFQLSDGSKIYRLPAWIKRATQPSKETAKQWGHSYEARFWNPSEQYTFRNKRPS